MIVMPPSDKAVVAAACFAILLAAPANGGLLQPGDLRLRHDIQLLADAGVVKAPITGWPLFLTGMDLGDIDPGQLDPGTARALERVFPFRQPHEALRLDVAIGGIDPSERFRGFNDVPREGGEASARLAWERDRFSFDVQATWVNDPTDRRDWRADGSYVGVELGNWFLAASATDRWWGPGWDGSLVLSNNARPIPAITLQRRRALAPRLRGLRWLGPWTTQVLFGGLESDRDVPNARLFGWRFGFKPLPKLEIGLSRTAQWCGDGRPCGSDTFLDLLRGRDNAGQNIDPREEPGNQLAGFDLRFSFSAAGHPWAFYTQWMGEDEQDGLPSGYLAQLGLETWSSWGASGGSYRVYAEYSETTCSALTDSDPNFGCAYNNSIYTDGYRYRGRVIGHSLDGDGVMFSVGALLLNGPGSTWQILVRRAEVNRSDDPRNSLSPLKRDVVTLTLSHTRDFGSAGKLTLGLEGEVSEVTSSGEDFDQTRVFAQWRWQLNGND